MSAKRTRVDAPNEDDNTSSRSEVFSIDEDNYDSNDTDSDDEESDFYQYMTMDHDNGAYNYNKNNIRNDSSDGISNKPIETKEYSKHQRLKRKNLISLMQQRAQLLCEKNKVANEDINSLYTHMDNLKRVYSVYTQLFLMYYFLTLHENSHSNLTKILAPSAVVKVPRNPYFSVNDASCVTELRGIEAVQYQREAMKFILSTIARSVGNVCQSLLFGTKMLQDTFIINNRTATAGFTVSSKNAMLCGGRKELAFKGMVICQFGSNNTIESLELLYNWTEIDIQIIAAFGNHAVFHRIDSILYYNYIMNRLHKDYVSESSDTVGGTDSNGTLSGDTLLSQSQNNALNRRCFVTSTLDYKNKLFTNIDGPAKNIDSFMSINCEFRGAQPTTMQACLAHVSKEAWDSAWNCVTNNTPSFFSINGNNQDESYFIQIFPLIVPVKSGAPTHAVFLAYPCKRIDEEMSIFYSIYTFLSFVLYKYNHYSKVYKAPADNAANSQGLDESTPNLIYYSGVVGCVLAEVSDILSIPRVGASAHNALDVLYSQLNRFMKMIKYVEKICSSFIEVEVPSDAYVVRPEEVEEKSILRRLVQEFNIYFTQVRDSCLIAQFIKHLTRAMDDTQRVVYEQYLYLCWTRHSSVFIQELLVSAIEYALEHKFNEALQALGEVISADPFFAEGYNRRASIYFGLNRADDCFRDIDRALKLEPFHYGTMCGKALMLTKLSKFEEAISVFNQAIAINAGLGKPETSLNQKLQKCHEEVRKASTQADKPDLCYEANVI